MGVPAPRAPVVPMPLPIGLIIELCGREEVWEWDTSGMRTGQYWYGNETVVVWEVRQVRGSSKELKSGRIRTRMLLHRCGTEESTYPAVLLSGVQDSVEEKAHLG